MNRKEPASPSSSDAPAPTAIGLTSWRAVADTERPRIELKTALPASSRSVCTTLGVVLPRAFTSAVSPRKASLCVKSSTPEMAAPMPPARPAAAAPAKVSTVELRLVATITLPPASTVPPSMPARNLPAVPARVTEPAMPKPSAADSPAARSSTSSTEKTSTITWSFASTVEPRIEASVVSNASSASRQSRKLPSHSASSSARSRMSTPKITAATAAPTLASPAAVAVAPATLSALRTREARTCTVSGTRANGLSAVTVALRMKAPVAPLVCVSAIDAAIPSSSEPDTLPEAKDRMSSVAVASTRTPAGPESRKPRPASTVAESISANTSWTTCV